MGWARWKVRWSPFVSYDKLHTMHAYEFVCKNRKLVKESLFFFKLKSDGLFGVCMCVHCTPCSMPNTFLCQASLHSNGNNNKKKRPATWLCRIQKKKKRTSPTIFCSNAFFTKHPQNRKSKAVSLVNAKLNAIQLSMHHFFTSEYAFQSIVSYSIYCLYGTYTVQHILMYSEMNAIFISVAIKFLNVLTRYIKSFCYINFSMIRALVMYKMLEPTEQICLYSRSPEAALA